MVTQPKKVEPNLPPNIPVPSWRDGSTAKRLVSAALVVSGVIGLVSESFPLFPSVADSVASALRIVGAVGVVVGVLIFLAGHLQAAYRRWRAYDVLWAGWRDEVLRLMQQNQELHMRYVELLRSHPGVQAYAIKRPIERFGNERLMICLEPKELPRTGLVFGLALSSYHDLVTGQQLLVYDLEARREYGRLEVLEERSMTEGPMAVVLEGADPLWEGYMRATIGSGSIYTSELIAVFVPERGNHV